jgi:homoserine O-succinyltransferase
VDQIVADGSRHGVASPLVIGLVNSMPGEARRHTERQFRAILSAAARGRPLELRFFSFDPVASDRADPRYDDIGALEAAAPDGLIVTGAPPRATRLRDEPYWPKLTRLADFAMEAGMPTMWSCLAAHAAVLHLDGIERVRLPQKLSGVVECARTGAGHPAMQDLPQRWHVPHSRYNDLPEHDLLACGYTILSRSDAAGADIFAKDTFVKDTGAPFLFCQGHPEYDAHALLREYRRDIRQFLAGERDEFPRAPHGCFGAEVTARLDAFRGRALCERTVDVFENFPMAACLADLRHTWQQVAFGLYGNWLAQVAERKAGRDVRAAAFTPSEYPAAAA